MNKKRLMIGGLVVGALLVGSVAAPGAVRAQAAAGVPRNVSAAAVLRSKDVVLASGKLKALDKTRFDLFRRAGFQDGLACVAPMPIAAPDVDLHRTLFVHDAATLSAGNFSLRRTLQKLATDVSGSVATTPEAIFRQFMDTQNDIVNQVTPGNPHCSDNNGKINGYPFNKCPRSEGAEAVGTDPVIAARINNDYKPIAMVDRIDLADKGWRNCGEHRIVYGKQSGISKNLIIFEAVLPNPKPGCRSGCRDVIEFWLDLSSDSNPTSRAAKLETFYYTGLPGFQPVVHTSHYTSGTSSVYGGSASGQIRTNEFLFKPVLGQGPWTLKEFKTFLSCAGGSCSYDVLPNTVKVNPYGVLWNRDVATGALIPALPPDNTYATPIAGLPALATAFEAEVLAQVTADKLANPDLNGISYEVKLDKDAAESQSQGPIIDHYPNQAAAAADATFRTNLDGVAAPFGLTGVQIVNRATANSCAGCHKPDAFGLTLMNAIGPGMSWPSALTFVHVDTPLGSIAAEPGFDPTKFAGNVNGFTISPALLNSFLPARRTNFVDIANKDVCDCVPKPDILFPAKEALPKRKAILEASSQQLKAQIAAANKAFAAKPIVKAGDIQRLLADQKAIIAKAEAVRDADLEKTGMKLDPLPVKPEPVSLGNEKLSGEKLQKAKTDKLRELVDAEPPRETITGSFRSH